MVSIIETVNYLNQIEKDGLTIKATVFPERSNQMSRVSGKLTRKAGDFYRVVSPSGDIIEFHFNDIMDIRLLATLTAIVPFEIDIRWR